MKIEVFRYRETRARVLEAIFIASLLAANVLAVKLIGWNFVQSAGVLAYPITFLVTDAIGDVLGKRRARRLVWLGFLAQVFFLILVTIGRYIRYPEFWTGQEAYVAVVGLIPRIVLGSLIAYLIAQLHDVVAFHFWKRLTKGRWFWLRNNLSTMVSQAIDTVVFISIAFIGVFDGAHIWEMIWVMYVTKLVFAACDTPIVYLAVKWLRNGEVWTGAEPQA